LSRRAPRKPRPPAPTGDPPPNDPTLAARVRENTGLAWSRARALCIEGRVTVDGERCVDPARRVAPASRVEVDPTARKLDTGPLAREGIVFRDRDLVVVNKPAGLLSVADEPGNTDTLADHARTVLRRIDPGGDVKLGVVHRLDKETSGLMVFTRSALAKRVLAARFREHQVDRLYHAIATAPSPRHAWRAISSSIVVTGCVARMAISAARTLRRPRTRATPSRMCARSSH
jgi:23S rRNA pseudouridine1911/1915/1917 synthase